MDQRSNENSARTARVRRLQILRKFGVFCCMRRAAASSGLFVTPLIYWTFPRERAAASVLTRFLRSA
jgi:hypothetical protein